MTEEMLDKVTACFGRGGGCRRECQCGREHFDGSGRGGYDWEEGELEGLLEHAKTNPDRYIGSDGGPLSFSFGEMEIVIGCPCEMDKRICQSILDAAPNLARLFNELSKSMEQRAKALKVAGVLASPNAWKVQQFIEQANNLLNE